MSLQDAAVLALYYPQAGEDHLVFTIRTDKVLHHKGQICFPGGARDPQDKTLWDTALRETYEEIGLDRDQVVFLKELPSHETPSGFRVVPFVGKVDGPVVWVPNEHEIAEIFTVPLKHLQDPKNLRFTKQMWDGREYSNPIFSYRHYEIWGVTGRILLSVIE